MKLRTKAFALRVIKVASTVSGDFVGRRLGDQLLRAGTSVAANYRAACRARSKAEFMSKLGIAEEAKLMDEANQLTAIIVASRKTCGKRLDC